MNLGGTVRLNKCGVIFVCVVLLVLIFYVYPKGTSVEYKGQVNLRQLLIASVDAAEKGGIEVVKVREGSDIGEKSKGKTKEGKNVPVTEADLKSHCAMYSRLHSVFPFVKFVSEEKQPNCDSSRIEDISSPSGTEALPDEHVDQSDLVIWIDPLDATQEFTENILECVSTMVCVAYKGRPIISVIHFPFEKPPQTYWAWQSKGLSTNLKSTGAPQNATKKVIVSRSHPGEVEKKIKAGLGSDMSVINAGGSGYKVLQVVKGNVAAYIHVTEIKKWDVCAGDGLLRSLNGQLTTLDNEEIDFSDVEQKTVKKGIVATLTDHFKFVNKISV